MDFVTTTTYAWVDLVMTINFVKRMAEEFKKAALKGGDQSDPIVKNLAENSKATIDIFVSYLESADEIEKNKILVNKLEEVNHATKEKITGKNKK